MAQLVDNHRQRGKPYERNY